MKAKTAYIRFDSVYGTWEFKKTLGRWDSENGWTKIIYFEIEEDE